MVKILACGDWKLEMIGKFKFFARGGFAPMGGHIDNYSVDDYICQIK